MGKSKGSASNRTQKEIIELPRAPQKVSFPTPPSVRCFYRWRSDAARIYLRSVRGAMHDVSALVASGAGMTTVMLAGN